MTSLSSQVLTMDATRQYCRFNFLRKVFAVSFFVICALVVFIDTFFLRVVSPIMMKMNTQYHGKDIDGFNKLGVGKRYTSGDTEEKLVFLQHQGLKNIGYDPIEKHSFKSPYIMEPKVYSQDIYDIWLGHLPQNTKTKIISIYKAEGRNWWIRKHTYNAKNDLCKYKCEVDYDAKKLDVADLVIFICAGMPSTISRPQNQLWALLCYESPQHWWYPNYPFWKDQFNMTISYRLDSDIFHPYVKLGWRDPDLLYKDEKYLEIAKTKTKTATWWVSNCREDRFKFVEEMKKYIDIDIYGKCTEYNECKDGRSDYECRQSLNTTYKFYLAFENSFCEDYVTEKFSKAFLDRTQILPVVMGGANYSNYFPDNTFVNGNNFKNAKELALYLKDLANDVPRYSQMLKDKDRLQAIPRFGHDWCAFCETLHTRKFGTKNDIKGWSHNGGCTDHRYILADTP